MGRRRKSDRDNISIDSLKANKIAKRANKSAKPHKYTSIYTGKEITLQQFIVEAIYANNGVKDVAKYLGGNAIRSNDYRRIISVIGMFLKKIDAKDLYYIVVHNRIKKVEDLFWRVKQLEHIEELKKLPKDKSDKKLDQFNAGPDLREDVKKNKYSSLFERLNNQE